MKFNPCGHCVDCRSCKSPCEHGEWGIHGWTDEKGKGWVHDGCRVACCLCRYTDEQNDWLRKQEKQDA